MNEEDDDYPSLQLMRGRDEAWVTGDVEGWEALPHLLGGVDDPWGLQRRRRSSRTPRAHLRSAFPAYELIEMDAGPMDRSAPFAVPRLPVLRPGSRAKARRYKGPVKRAATLTPAAIGRAEARIRTSSRSPESGLLKLKLSVRAGLRASEIAHLPIEAMLDSNGRISGMIDVYASKTRNRRMVPMHDDIEAALRALLIRHPYATHAAFSVGRHGRLRRQKASAVANWFYRLYQSAGLFGCSSHSGRRTFATELGRRLGSYQASLKDLQLVLGHASLSSTECYLEPSDRLGDLVRSLGA